MDEQREYARLLHSSGYGIALRQPTHDIDVGDICYWSPNGKATRILNVFDNKEWLAQNNWPKLSITREQILDKSTNNNLQIIQGGGVNWTITSQYNHGFDISFSRTGSDTAICMPASPCTIIGLRASGKHHLEQWWLRAKRNAFHTWSYLLNSPTGIFLVLKTVKSARYATCLSHGNQGQVSQIRVHGTMKIPRNNDDLELPINGTQWFPVRNDLSMDLHETERRGEFTIFMERDSTLMFSMAEGQGKEAAQKYWEYDPPAKCINCSACTPRNPNPMPLPNQWGAPAPGWGNGTPINWPQPNLAPPAAAAARPSSPATFDGKDRITITEGWFLIRGEGSFFIEHAGTGLDLPPKDINMANLLKLLTLPEAQAPPTQPAPPVIAPIPQGPFPVQWGQQPGPGPMAGGQPPMGGGQVPMGAPVPMGNPHIPQVNPPFPQINLPLPMAPAQPNPPPPLGFNANPQMPFNPALMPMPMPAPAFANPMQAAAMAHPPQGYPQHPPQMMMQGPIPMPGPPMQMQMPMQPPPQIPGVAHISPPLGGNVMAGAVFGAGLTPLPLPEIKDGRPVESVLPSYAGFNLTSTGNGPPTITIKPGGNPVEVPWGWN